MHKTANHTAAPAAQFSPGPWYIVTAPNGLRMITTSPAPQMGAVPICVFSCDDEGYRPKAERDANVRVVVMAPELFGACVAIVEACEEALRIYGDKMPATAGMIAAALKARSAVQRVKGGV